MPAWLNPKACAMLRAPRAMPRSPIPRSPSASSRLRVEDRGCTAVHGRMPSTAYHCTLFASTAHSAHCFPLCETGTAFVAPPKLT